jgi:putative transposase
MMGPASVCGPSVRTTSSPHDFVESRTHDGRKFRMLNLIDEFTRECLAIRVDRKLRSTDVIDVLSDLFILRGVPDHIRSDNVLCWDLSAA